MATLPLVGTAVGTVAGILDGIIAQPAISIPGLIGPWRPPQWNSGKVPLTMTATDPHTGLQTVYVFDAIIVAEHERRAVVTKNPVQTGAAVSDHIYIEPARLDIEIAMSDAMQSFTYGQWATAPSRSVSCFQTLDALQKALTRVDITTRLNTYGPMVITNVYAHDDEKTTFALKAHITFEELILANVQTVYSQSNLPVSSTIPQST